VFSLTCSVCENGCVDVICEVVDNIFVSFEKKCSCTNILTSLENSLMEKMRILRLLISGG
jgi:hypothetical protein